MTQKNYFMLVCWLWHCAATAVALQMHEGVNAFNLVLSIKLFGIILLIQLSLQFYFHGYAYTFAAIGKLSFP